MASAVTQAVITAMQAGMVDNIEIANYVRQHVPGAETTPASVSSIKSRLKQTSSLDPSLIQARSVSGFIIPLAEPIADETDEEASDRISVRYHAMERMSRRAVAGRVPSLIISGPPGLGKSFTVKAAISEARLEQFIPGEGFDPGEDADMVEVEDPLEASGSRHERQRYYDMISGSITAVGLYQALYWMREGGVLILDDVDDVFRDETSLNLLKAALDSSPIRHLSWRKEARWLEDYGIPKTFEFKGTVVFLTNIDFEDVIRKGHRDAEHFKALIDRSLYLCLTLRSQRDFMLRIRQVAAGADGMLVKQFGLTVEQAEEVLQYMDDNRGKFYNLSLRLAGQIAIIRADAEDGIDWQKDVEATKMRTF